VVSHSCHWPQHWPQLQRLLKWRVTEMYTRRFNYSIVANDMNEWPQ
jgi:hypothetical protein